MEKNLKNQQLCHPTIHQKIRIGQVKLETHLVVRGEMQLHIQNLKNQQICHPTIHQKIRVGPVKLETHLVVIEELSLHIPRNPKEEKGEKDFNQYFGCRCCDNWIYGM